MLWHSDEVKNIGVGNKKYASQEKGENRKKNKRRPGKWSGT